VFVADGRPAVLGGGIDDQPGVERCVWGDVANLLRTDLPWWPCGLRERDAMLMWRPGDDPLAISPATADRDPAALLDVLTPDSSTGLRHTVAKMIRTIEHDLCGHFISGRDQYTRSPVSPTQHSSPKTTTPRRLRAAAVRPHCSCTNRCPTRSSPRAPPPTTRSRHYAYAIKPTNRDHPLITEWLSRLRPAGTSRRDEIGYQLALSLLPVELGPDDHLAPTGFHTDPNWPDCWIVSSGETIIVTMGDVRPGPRCASARLPRRGAAFFRDSAGGVWPLPYTKSPRHRHRRGPGPDHHRLMGDAGADVESHPTRRSRRMSCCGSTFRRHRCRSS
jgi:hypothetical protein